MKLVSGMQGDEEPGDGRRKAKKEQRRKKEIGQVKAEERSCQQGILAEAKDRERERREPMNATQLDKNCLVCKLSSKEYSKYFFIQAFCGFGFL